MGIAPTAALAPDRGERLAAAGWSALSPADEALYRRHMDAHPVPHSYELCWAYVTQQARLAAYKKLSDGVLLTAVVKDWRSPFVFLLPPIGPTRAVAEALPGLAASLAEATGRRVVLRKAPADLEAGLRGRGFARIPPEAFAIAVDYPEDVHPQPVVETNIDDRLGLPHFQKTRNQLRFLERTHEVGVRTMSAGVAADLTALVDRWAAAHNRRVLADDRERGGIADADAYHCLIDAFAHRIDDRDYFGLVLILNGRPAGFCFAGRTGPDTAALYASLATVAARGASEYLAVAFLRHLGAAGIATLNLGGSETLGLYRYKMKYDPVRLIRVTDLAFSF